MLSRLPIRWKVTLAFAGALALVLVAVGAFLYLRFEAGLDRTLDAGLRSRAADVATQLREGDTGLHDARASPLAEAGESFAQIIGGGRVVDATPGFARTPLLDGTQLARAPSGSFYVDRDGIAPDGERARLLAAPVTTAAGRFVIVTGAALDDRDGELATLLTLLLLGLGAALVLAAAAGYAVAGIALRPVEAMRVGAEAITERHPGRRLPVPPARDEIARLGSTLNAMLARLDAALTAERRFVADASHELRTPLTVLKSEVDVALLEQRSPEELTAALRSVSEEADRLNRLADDLLVLARIDEGRLPIRREEVTVARLLADVAERFRPRFERERRRLSTDAPGGLTINADRLRLEQALGNLLDNALRHGAGAVLLAARELDGGIELSVSDEGPGFPASFAGRAFERFSRPDDGRSATGSGLGLSIARAIARSHGGDAEAEDRRSGARVWLSLPSAP